ncbi:VOC family protein [Proteocatella sphenisci]|uniref:VOC family protein n=1 Tax=Proteocatella sphenisci TaxID=181070 RepID=UPI00048C9319|nr:VOC family protein [Proteocatella sphenisci]
MEFKIIHNNINVLNLEKSITFYKDALGMEIKREYEPQDKSFKLVYLETGSGTHQLELTWMRDRVESYNLGDNEFHLAFETDDFEGAYKKHKDMGCICFENKTMGIYFISDPDGYWLEILPSK